MRLSYKTVINAETKEKKFSSVDLAKVEKVKADLEKASPNAKFKIVYSWGNI